MWIRLPRPARRAERFCVRTVISWVTFTFNQCRGGGGGTAIVPLPLHVTARVRHCAAPWDPGHASADSHRGWHCCLNSPHVPDRPPTRCPRINIGRLTGRIAITTHERVTRGRVRYSSNKKCVAVKYRSSTLVRTSCARTTAISPTFSRFDNHRHRRRSRAIALACLSRGSGSGSGSGIGIGIGIDRRA